MYGLTLTHLKSSTVAAPVAFKPMMKTRQVTNWSVEMNDGVGIRWMHSLLTRSSELEEAEKASMAMTASPECGFSVPPPMFTRVLPPMTRLAADRRALRENNSQTNSQNP